MDQSNRYANLNLREEDLIAEGKHVLCAYIMKPKEGYGYLETAAHFAAESSTGTNVDVSTTDDFTRDEILRARQIGLNAVRVHVKIGLPRKLYWADRLGYLTWGEFYDWGLDFGDPQALYFGGDMEAALALTGQAAGLGAYYYFGLLLAAGLALYQQFLIRERRPERCFKAFLNNNWFGAVVFAGIILDFLAKA